MEARSSSFAGIATERKLATLAHPVRLALLLLLALLATPARGEQEALLPLPATAVVERLRSAPFEIVAVKRTSRGVTGAHKIRVRFPDDLELDVKWKPAPAAEADGWNNSPRKELAAAAVQALFLDPDEFVVPPTATRCLPLEQHSAIDPDSAPQVPATRCVVGLAAAWLGNVQIADPLLDPERLRTSASYVRSIGNLNLLTFLIDHRDARVGNFLITRSDPTRVFSIDNGVSFGEWFHNYFVLNWNVLRVDRVPARSVQRLRAVGADDLAALSVLVQLAADDAGMLRREPPTSPWDAKQGARVRPGQLQLGLTASEIQGVAERLAALLVRVDAGEIALLPPQGPPAGDPAD